MFRNHAIRAPYNITKFEDAIAHILTHLPSITNATTLRLVIFGSASGKDEYLEQREIIDDAISIFFDDRQPVWSYVAQPPFESCIVAEVWWLDDEEEWDIQHKEFENQHYIALTKGSAKSVLIGGLTNFDSEQTRKIYAQSQSISTEIAKILEHEDMPLNSIVRQWNYIEEITREGSETQHYQEFNDARSELYTTTKWNDGYPAATGIGSATGGVVIDVCAATGCEIRAIDNRLQVAAHDYSSELLIGEQSKKTTPKFERAKLCDSIFYISGTAAIRGEESLRGVAAAQQCRITLENIDELIESAQCRRAESLRVYIKNREDYAEIREVVERYAPCDAIYLHADICREELLVEIEAIAYKK